MKLTGLTERLRKGLPLEYCGAVIVAAGNASRMGGIDKMMTPLAGEPVIVHTVRGVSRCDAIREIVVVTRQELIEPVKRLCAGYEKVRAVVAGGGSRQASVNLGMDALSEQVRLVAVHDGARPLVSWQLIDRVVRAAHTYGAAVPVIPVKDTIKVVSGGLVVQTPERNSLYAAQTPQVFDRDLLRGALQKAVEDGAAVTDDCSAVERMGMSVKMVSGEERNIKITTPLDLKLAQILLEELK